MCPFCYIGKRTLESALENFDQKDDLEIIWKSFQLDPNMPETPQGSQAEYLSKNKGLPIQQVEGMMANVTEYAKQVGLDFNLKDAVMVNSFRAHRFIQIAKERGLGDEAEELIFRAYFTEGKNIADEEILKEIATEIGLSEADVQTALQDDQYAYQVKQDIQQAQHLGVRGVPFFVFDNKYAISGAQPVEQFSQTLDKAFSEWTAETKPKLEISEGDSCSVENTNCP